MEHALFAEAGVWEGKGTVTGENGDLKCEVSAIVAVSGNDLKLDVTQKLGDNSMRKRCYIIKGAGKFSMSAQLMVEVSGKGTLAGAATMMTGSVILTYAKEGSEISFMENIMETAGNRARIKGSMMDDFDIKESWNLEIYRKG